MGIDNRHNATGCSVHYIYGPIHERTSIFTHVLWVIQHSIDYGPIREWDSAFAKLLLVIKYTVNYGPIHEWASNLRQLRLYLR